MKKDHYYTWSIDIYWRFFAPKYLRFWKFQRDTFLDGGSVEWSFGAFVLSKKIHWIR